MNKRVVIVHGWADDPTQGWINWLVGELEQQGMTAMAPAFPEPDKPDIGRWLEYLRTQTGELHGETVLVGHSLGCYLVTLLLSERRLPQPLAGVVLVAGGLPEHRPNLMKQLDFELIKQNTKHRVCIYSDDDRVVPQEASQKFAKALSAEEIVDPGKRHFSGLRGVTELPSALAAVTSCFESS